MKPKEWPEYWELALDFYTDKEGTHVGRALLVVEGLGSRHAVGF